MNSVNLLLIDVCVHATRGMEYTGRSFRFFEQMQHNTSFVLNMLMARIVARRR